MSKVVSQETKCSILKYYENMKQDRPDLSYDDLVTG
jgi:DNA-directed RNA polymerase subunit H (RpoH/RPB5)